MCLHNESMSLMNLRHVFYGEGVLARACVCVCAAEPVTRKGLDVSRQADSCSARRPQVCVCVGRAEGEGGRGRPLVAFKPTFSFQQ